MGEAPGQTEREAGTPLTMRGRYAFAVHRSPDGEHPPIVSIIDFDRAHGWPGDLDAILADLALQGIAPRNHCFLYRDRTSWYELHVEADGSCSGVAILHTQSEPEARSRLIARSRARRALAGGHADASERPAELREKPRAQVLPFTPRERRP